MLKLGEVGKRNNLTTEGVPYESVSYRSYDTITDLVYNLSAGHHRSADLYRRIAAAHEQVRSDKKKPSSQERY